MKLFSPARIHLGFLEMNQSLPRFFGSLGLTISKYGFEIEIKSSVLISPDVQALDFAWVWASR